MMATERSISFGTSTIPFVVHRSARRSTVTIAVDLADGVLVLAPEELDGQAIDDVVREKGAWVVQRLAEFEELGPPPPPREFVSGESFSYLGRQYRLLVDRRADCESAVVKLRGGWLETTIPEAGTQATLVRSGLTAWYKGLAAKRIPERVRLYAERLGVDEPKVLVRDQAKRWGSCTSKGELRFNWRIVMGPMSLVDYVVAHEVCHLRVADHSARFWKLLGMIQPDHETRKERLRREGINFRL